MEDHPLTEERNCAFQYAEIKTILFRDVKIVEDKSELTITEAKELWNKYYPQAATYIAGMKLKWLSG